MCEKQEEKNGVGVPDGVLLEVGKRRPYRRQGRGLNSHRERTRARKDFL